MNNKHNCLFYCRVVNSGYSVLLTLLTIDFFWLLERIQCPLCRARGGDEATAKANCDENVRIATCPVGRTLCVDYFSPSERYFRRGCTTPKLYNKFVLKCQQVGCRLKNCTHPRCMAGEGPGMNFFQPFCTSLTPVNSVGKKTSSLCSTWSMKNSVG